MPENTRRGDYRSASISGEFVQRLSFAKGQPVLQHSITIGGVTKDCSGGIPKNVLEDEEEGRIVGNCPSCYSNAIWNGEEWSILDATG